MADLKTQLANELSKLISIDSQNPPGNEKAIISYLDKEFKKLKIRSKIIGKANRLNLINSIKLGSGKRKIMFMTHVDTVPGSRGWTTKFLKPVIKNNKLYGLGSGDMKCAAASHMVLIKEIMKNQKKYASINATLSFAFCADEETGGKLGAEMLLKNHSQLFNQDLVIVGEPTNQKLIVSHKGVIQAEIEIFGKSAHASTPHLGTNSIQVASRLIGELSKLKLNSKPNRYLSPPLTVNFGIISGGDALNKVADYCKFGIDIRHIPEITSKNILAEVKSIINKIKSSHSKSKLSWTYKIKVLETGKAAQSSVATIKKVEKILKRKAQGVSYSTDSRFLKCDFIIYGAGDEKLAHCPNEYVDLNKLVKVHKDYVKLVEEY
ncbi:ArgE/DapE family deacylase [Candidatus Woesearchaeota archaeon]|jgi:succinyl-diaminopimelate desuccinylase|nr:ArgE/DapE family deacylase [Candidatus Woesearchaeota archaeon]